jgi:hypothetical protein
LFDIWLAFVDLSCFLGERHGALAKKHWGVGFRHKKYACQPKDASKDSHDAFDPAPSDGLADETSNYNI